MRPSTPYTTLCCAILLIIACFVTINAQAATSLPYVAVATFDLSQLSLSTTASTPENIISLLDDFVTQYIEPTLDSTSLSDVVMETFISSDLLQFNLTIASPNEINGSLSSVSFPYTDSTTGLILDFEVVEEDFNSTLCIFESDAAGVTNASLFVVDDDECLINGVVPANPTCYQDSDCPSSAPYCIATGLGTWVSSSQSYLAPANVCSASSISITQEPNFVVIQTITIPAETTVQDSFDSLSLSVQDWILTSLNETEYCSDVDWSVTIPDLSSPTTANIYIIGVSTECYVALYSNYSSTLTISNWNLPSQCFSTSSLVFSVIADADGMVNTCLDETSTYCTVPCPVLMPCSENSDCSSDSTCSIVSLLSQTTFENSTFCTESATTQYNLYQYTISLQLTEAESAQLTTAVTLLLLKQAAGEYRSDYYDNDCWTNETIVGLYVPVSNSSSSLVTTAYMFAANVANDTECQVETSITITPSSFDVDDNYFLNKIELQTHISAPINIAAIPSTVQIIEEFSNPFALSATESISQYDVSLAVTLLSNDLNSNSCIQNNEFVFSSNCSEFATLGFTTSATSNCVTNDDCTNNSTCQYVESDNAYVLRCTASSVNATNLVQYTLTVSQSGFADQSLHKLNLALEKFQTYMESECWSIDSVIHVHYPSSKTPNIAIIYVSDVSLALECSVLSATTVKSFGASQILIDSFVEDFNTELCIEDDTFVCTTTECSDIIECGIGAFAPCTNSSQCDTNFTCGYFNSAQLVCLDAKNSAFTISTSILLFYLIGSLSMLFLMN